jgi:hypothetical protein
LLFRLPTPAGNGEDGYKWRIKGSSGKKCSVMVDIAIFKPTAEISRNIQPEAAVA